jgi:folate-binding protein YgfZ
VPRSFPSSAAVIPPDYAKARDRLAHRRRPGVVAVEGADRESFLQGQLTQDVLGLAPGESRPAAGLTPKGKLLFFGRLVAEPERLLLLLPADAVAGALAHLAKFAAFQKASIRDATADYDRVALYGPGAADFARGVEGIGLPPEGEFAGEILAPASSGPALDRRLAQAGSTEVSPETAEILRIEAGRPRLGRDADETNLPDEVRLEGAISTTKGCYVGQEVVARLRTYGRVNRRLVGFRFPQEPVAAGSVFASPDKPGLELARVTSTALSPRFGAIGLGFAFRDVPEGETLRSLEAAGRTAVVSALPFA